MLKEDCFFLGTIVGKFSFKGEILVKLDTDQPNTYINLQSIFVETPQGLVPYFVDRCRLHKSSSKKDLFLPVDMLPKLEGNQFYYHEVTGFSVIDQFDTKIGTIKTVNDSGPQPLFVIDSSGNEILIPIHDDFIKELDRKSEKIFLDLPEGLLDIFK